MSSKSRHYTPEEKKIFLDILKDFKEVVEAKKSDASTLREKKEAWETILEKYNNCLRITQNRTVAQLKKLWMNMKSTQRDALTTERQACMATGGGPPLPSAEIDPDIAAIAPHLMALAPTHFFSNINDEDRDAYKNDALETNEEYLIEYLDDMVEGGNVGTELGVVESYADPSSQLALSSSSQAVGPVIVSSKQVVKKRRLDAGRRRTASSAESSSTGSTATDEEKVQRIANITQQEKELFEIKRLHLTFMNKMQAEHLKELQELEIRKATAEAELTEFQLARAREDDFK